MSMSLGAWALPTAPPGSVLPLLASWRWDEGGRGRRGGREGEGGGEGREGEGGGEGREGEGGGEDAMQFFEL